MKRLTYILLFLAISTLAIAQEFTVKRFEATNDLTARDSRYLRNDLNGNPCALIKVQTSLDGMVFEGNVIGNVANKTGEYWVYLPAGDKRLKVKHIGFEPLTILFGDYGIERLETKMTYVLALSASSAVMQEQLLSVKYSPKDAVLLIDGQMEGDKGVAELKLTVGNHTYNVAKKGYIGQQGMVTLTAGAPGKLIVELDKESVAANNNANNVHSAQQQAISQASQPSVQQSHVADSPWDNSPKTFTVKGVSFNMIPIDGGNALIGAVSGLDEYKDAEPNEKPAHNVVLNSFMLGETEVTQELWKAVMGKNPSTYKGNKNPVETVSWDDCQAFITKLNALTGQKFRLPTEAEWEYACAGHGKGKADLYSGGEDIDEHVVYLMTSNTEKAKHHSHLPVKSKKPNVHGLYDMSGNVWEWCQDWYGEYTKELQINPTGPSSGNAHVIRGGSWFNNAKICRSTTRHEQKATSRTGMIGFRLALSADKPENIIRGIVVDESGEPVFGALINNKGTHNGTISNHDGSFITVVPDGGELEFKFIGGEPITLKAYDNMKVVLKESK